MRTINKILHEVNCKYGAPMGRRSIGEKPSDKKVFNCWVRLDNGAYDKGGAYWGFPNNLWVEYTKDLSYIRFYRTY